MYCCYWVIGGYYDLADVIVVADNDLLVKQGDILGLEWHNESIFHLTDSSQYHIDIFLYEQNNFGHGGGMVTITWSNITLASNISNTGTTNITLPFFNMSNQIKGYYAFSPYVVVLVKIGVNTSTINPGTNNSYLLALKTLNDLGDVPGRWTHVLFRKYWNTSDDLCVWWLNDYILKSIPRTDDRHCPCNVFQAELPNSGFDQQIHAGRNIVDRFTHSDSSVCYYSLE